MTISFTGESNYDSHMVTLTSQIDLLAKAYYRDWLQEGGYTV